MRRDSRFGSAEGSDETDTVGAKLGGLRELDAKLASAFDLRTCLKPEVALMLELYQADREGRAMTVSVLGLLDGIASTTTLRYLDMLQKKGLVRRVAHESDNRMTYVELTELAKLAMDQVLGEG
ncbi:MAG: winged helix DNA-binding protein [Pseudomonadota bacterium]